MTVKKFNQMLKGIATLLIGSVSARLIGIISIPVLTRIYSPEDYGSLAIFTVLTTITSTILGLRFSQAIPLPKKDSVAFHVFCLGFISIVLMSGLFFLSFLFLSDSIFDLLNAQELKKWWWLLIIASFSISTFELLTMWSVRLKSYKLISMIQIKQSFLGEITKLVVGLAELKPLGLILGHFVGQSFGIKTYLSGSFVFFKNEIKKITINRILFLVKYYAHFVYYRLPSDLLLILSVQAPLIMTAKLYNSSITGQLSLTFMALSLPISLIAAAISRVYYAEISSIGRHNKSEIKALTFLVQKKLFFIAFPISLLVYILAEKIFSFVFGEEWAMAGKFASILAPFLLLQFMSSPLMQLINVLGKQILFLFLNGGRVLGLVLLYILASSMQFKPENFIISLSLFLFLYYFFQSLVIFILLKSKKKL